MTYTPEPWTAKDCAEIKTLLQRIESDEAQYRIHLAAPELLAALKGLIGWADTVGWDNTGEPNEFDAGRAAIAKAEGK